MTGRDFFIDTDETLSQFLATIARNHLVALDTEFVREKTYYPKFCLIQIASPKFVGCVDCLAGVDLAPLFDFLFDSERAWVLHSARQDLEVIYQAAERVPHELIDTQIAAALLGHPSQIGLGDLLSAVLDVNLEKGYARTDWSRRPLPDPALRYAFDDVRHLLPLWERLRSALENLGRLGWFEEDCRAALATPPLTPPTALWARLRGRGSLELRSQCAALALVRWRERCAQTLDRPRRWILSDDLLLRIARSLPRNVDALKSIPEIPCRLAERWGTDILSSLEDCDRPETREVVSAHANGGRPDKKTLQELQERVRRRADELGIQAEILATRKELGELITGRSAERSTTGWRWVELEPLLSATA